MANNRIIACWGSPGSGATLTSVKIAHELARNKKNVILVLGDKETPMIPLLAPDLQGAKSLGGLLAIPKITPIDIFQHCVSIEKTMSLLGYLLGENELTWPEYDKEKAFSLLNLLRSIADYTVIDCSHHLLTDVLTGVTLQNADTVFRIVNADPKSLSYIKSQRPFLKDQRFYYEQQICVINNVHVFQDSKGYEEVLGGKATYTLPHIPALQSQFAESRLLEPLSGREGRLYEPKIRAMVKQEVLNGNQNSALNVRRKEELNEHTEPC